MAPRPHEGPNEDRPGGAPIRGPLGFPRHAGVSRPYRLPITGAFEGATLRSLQGRQGGQPARYIQATLSHVRSMCGIIPSSLEGRHSGWRGGSQRSTRS